MLQSPAWRRALRAGRQNKRTNYRSCGASSLENGMTFPLNTIETDVLVIGGGLAALRAALSARSAGARVLMLGKRLVGRSGSSTMTTGGYAAAFPELNDYDSSRLHYIDTMVGGGYLSDCRLVQALVDDAPARLSELWDF